MADAYLNAQLTNIGVDHDDRLLVEFNGGAVAVALSSTGALQLVAAISEAAQHLRDARGWGPAHQIAEIRAQALPDRPETRLMIRTIGNLQLPLTVPNALLVQLGRELEQLGLQPGTTSASGVN